jgi:uncharacterized protein YndB with AHSA1/START domain
VTEVVAQITQSLDGYVTGPSGRARRDDRTGGARRREATVRGLRPERRSPAGRGTPRSSRQGHLPGTTRRGALFERFVDGDELQVGNVVACEPPLRITFTWTTADWEGETEVEVIFTPRDEGTRVDLSHRGFDRLGPLGPDVAAKFRGGWPGVMHAFVQRSGRST